jgi:predicted GIY-YIG superfamily endonuclease
MREHKQGIGSEFASKYKIDRLVYYENTAMYATPSIERSKSKACCASRKLL